MCFEAALFVDAVAAGDLPELGQYAGWNDGQATDGSVSQPEQEVDPQEWETIEEGNRLRMEVLSPP